jgi:hypothetical protein
LRFAPTIAALAALCTAGAALAQAPSPKAPAAGAAAPGQAANLPIPEPIGLVVLIRSTLVALNQANQTGNYSVLRDLAAPSFQAANTQAQLAVAFTTLRDQKLDMAGIVAVTPELTEPPGIDPNGMLRLVGFFPTEPQRINFQLAFQPVAGTWRPIGLAIGTSPAEPVKAPVAEAQQRKQPPAKKQ